MGTKYDGSEGERRALEAYIALMRCTEALTTYLHRPLQEYDLTFGQFAVLEALYFKGPMRMGEVAKALLRSCGNTTVVVGNLEKRGHVLRKQDGEDRRVFSLELTEQGRALLAAIFPSHAERSLTAFSVLEPEELEKLSDLCKKLGKGVMEL